VKTSSGGGPKWMLTKKSEAFIGDDHHSGTD
jgi:hypothetical protein